MTDIRKTLTAEQSEIVAAFAQTYGIEPEDYFILLGKTRTFFYLRSDLYFMQRANRFGRY